MRWGSLWPAGYALFLPAALIAPFGDGSAAYAQIFVAFLIAVVASTLAARHAHMAGQCCAPVPAINHEIMPFGLARDRLIDGGI